MLFDTALPPTPLSMVPSIARKAEELGFNALWSSETIHNPFLPGSLIAEHTTSIKFGTAIAVSFARSPATMAYTAWDLAQASGGRFVLGLGTQVKAHIERRFGMGWPDSPVKKLREQIAAMRAIWRSWQTGERLNYRGDYYKLTLMSPFFNPGPIDHPNIPVFIAGVNPGMANLAGEVADGFLVHPFHSRQYLEEVILPGIEQGAKNAGRTRADISISVTAMIVSDPEEREFARQQVAFYASTPSYRPVMALHGWNEQAGTLSSLAARGKWSDMPGIISDDMLAVFTTISSTDHLADKLRERYNKIADRLNLYKPFVPGERDSFWKGLVNSFS